MRLVTFKQTTDQDEALKSLTKKTGEGITQIIRRLLIEECAKNGLLYPDDMPKPSRKRKAEAAS